MSSQKKTDTDVEWLLVKLQETISNVKLDGGKESSGKMGGTIGSTQVIQPQSGSSNKTSKDDGDVHKTILPSKVSSSSSSSSLSTDVVPVPATAAAADFFSKLTPDDAALLRKRLLEDSSVVVSIPGLLKHKHLYVGYSGACASSDTTATNPVDLTVTLAQGSGFNTRIGTAVRIHKITERIWHNRVVTGVMASGWKYPVRHEIFLVDKIPFTAYTTMPALYATGQNPPDPNSSAAPFNCLGGNPATTGQGYYINTAVRNPMSAAAYEVFGHHKIHTYEGNYSSLILLATDGRGVPSPYSLTYERSYEPKDMVWVYPNSATGTAIINRTWFQCYVDIPSTDRAGTPNVENFDVTFDIEFTDEPM